MNEFLKCYLKNCGKENKEVEEKFKSFNYSHFISIFYIFDVKLNIICGLFYEVN
jgi:hypothetical protein